MNDKESIIYLGYEIDPSGGGIQKYSFELLRELSESYELITFTKEAPAEDLLGALSISEYFFDKFLNYRRLDFYLRKYELRTIICGHLHYTGLANMLAKRFDTSYYLFGYGREVWGDKLLEYKDNFDSLEKFVGISEFTLNQVHQLALPSISLFKIPPVIKTSTSDPVKSHKYKKKVVLLTVSRLSTECKYKGHRKVMDAVESIDSDKFDLEYNIVGQGDDRESLENYARNNDIIHQVNFKGFVKDEDLPEEYLNSDIFIMPSRTTTENDRPKGEGFGIVYLEAAKFGLPIIGPNIGGPQEFLEDGVTGINVDPESTTDIKQAIINLSHDEKLRENYGESGRRKVVNQFSTTKLNTYLKDLGILE